MRREKNVILSLSINGRTVSKPLEMKKEVAMFYKSLCCHEKRIRPSCSNLLFKKLSPQYVAALEIPFSFEEVKDAILSGNVIRPSCSNHFLFFFIKKAWDTIGNDIYSMVLISTHQACYQKA
jgi:hypothetical protein